MEEFKSIFSTNDPAITKLQEISAQSTLKKKYKVFFNGGNSIEIEAEHDYSDSCFDCEAPMLRFFNGEPKSAQIVAVFNFENIAGYMAVNGFVYDDYDLGDED